MTRTVNEFIGENGIEEIFDFIQQCKKGEVNFHEFAEENNINEQDWFEFAWMMNEKLTPYGQDLIPVLDFNYLEVEREAKSYVEEHSPVRWGEIVDAVSEKHPNVEMQKINDWLAFGEVEVTEDESGQEVVTNISF